jgi:pyrimidine dimer DNA glycosylase
MRMWMVNPQLMCRQHLLGEHVEINMLVGTLLRRKSVAGFVENDLIEVHSIRARHAELVREMSRRGMNHKSPLPKFRSRKLGKIDPRTNLIELQRRCKACKAMQRRSS